MLLGASYVATGSVFAPIALHAASSMLLHSIAPLYLLQYSREKFAVPCSVQYSAATGDDSGVCQFACDIPRQLISNRQSDYYSYVAALHFYMYRQSERQKLKAVQDDDN